MQEPGPTLTFTLALAAGAAAQLLARHLRLPSIVPLFAAGILLGPDGVGWIDPAALGEGLFAIVALGVAIILFEGGLALDVGALRRERAPIRSLVTTGVLTTAVGAAAVANLCLGWPWRVAALFGTLVVVTGPTVIRPLLRHLHVRKRVATILEAEGVFNDPIGAIAVAVTLQLALAPSEETLGTTALGLVARLGFGLVAGLAFGAALSRVLSGSRAVPPGLGNVVTLAAVLACYEACEVVLPSSGILAVTVAGIVVGNLDESAARRVREFKERLTIGLIALLFVLLAADVRLADVVALGAPGAVAVGLLMLVVRPLAVGVGTAGSGLPPGEKLFLSWVAPRGVVAAAVASLSAALMQAEGLAHGTELRALVFLTIACTVVIQGSTAGFVARWCGVEARERDTTVIFPAGALALTLGRALATPGRDVVFVDRDPENVRRAQEAGFRVLYGDVFTEPTGLRLRFERPRTAIALGANEQENRLFAREARGELGAEEVYAAREPRAHPQADLARWREVRTLFDRPRDVEQWNARLRHGEAVLARFVRGPEAPGADADASEPDATAPGEAGAARDPCLVLAARRAGPGGEEGWEPMHADREPDADAEILALLHVPDEAEALERLAAQGWVRAGAG